MYNRIRVKLVAHKYDPVKKERIDEEIDGEVYIKNDVSQFLGVCENYMNACCKTLYYHKFLKGEIEENTTDIKLIVK